MSQMSDYLENALINATLRATTYTSPTTVYVALFKSDPTDAYIKTGEVSNAGAYVRKAVTFAAPSNGSSSNSADVVFDVATADWGTITHIGIVDSATWNAGNLLYFGALSASKTINNGDQFKILTNNLTVTLA